MANLPKEASEKIKELEQISDDQDRGDDKKPGKYYYDDAYGYENFDPEKVDHVDEDDADADA